MKDTLTGKVTTALSLSNDTLTVVVTGVSSTDTDGKLSVVYEGDYPGQKDVTVAEITYSVSEPTPPAQPDITIVEDAAAESVSLGEAESVEGWTVTDSGDAAYATFTLSVSEGAAYLQYVGTAATEEMQTVTVTDADSQEVYSATYVVTAASE